MNARVACIVPFCRRTAMRVPDDGDEQEIICGPHSRLISKGTRALWRRMRRKASEVQTQDPEALTLDKVKHGARVIRIARKVWERMKAEAIEAAGGIG